VWPDTPCNKVQKVFQLVAMPITSRSAFATAFSGMRVMLAAGGGLATQTITQMIRAMGSQQIDIVNSLADAQVQLDMSAPHVLVCEALLPDGTDAARLIGQLRQEKRLPKSSCVVVIARERDSRSVSALAEACADLVLIWPLEPEATKHRLGTLIQRRRVLFGLYQALDDNDLEAAKQAADEAIKKMPAVRSEALRVLSDALLLAGDLQGVDGVVEQAQQSNQVMAWSVVRQAQVHTEREEFDQASKLLKHVTAEQPHMLAAHDAMAQVCLQQGDVAGALQHTQAAAGSSKPQPQRLRVLALSALEQQQWDTAHSSLFDVVALDPQDSLAQIGLLRCLLKLNKASAAKARLGLIESLFTGQPETSWAQALFGFAKAEQDQNHQLIDEHLYSLVDTSLQHCAELPIELVLQAVDLCVLYGLKTQGYELALALAKTRRANRGQLIQLRKATEALSVLSQPAPSSPGPALEQTPDEAITTEAVSP
jgi:tetratricopeptide (TPR) repeat protein